MDLHATARTRNTDVSSDEPSALQGTGVFQQSNPVGYRLYAAMLAEPIAAAVSSAST